MLTELDREIVADTEALGKFINRRFDEVNLVDDDPKATALMIWKRWCARTPEDQAEAWREVFRQIGERIAERTTE